MDFEERLNALEKLVKDQQEQISGLTKQIASINDELTVIDSQMNRPGKPGYPSLYDVKEKLIEKNWLMKI
jgi:septal ring factor EnvC (AmiA/AmiB activator)